MPISQQHAFISLFSSTGSAPLQLFTTSTDKSLPSDSFIHFLNDKTSAPKPPHPRTLVSTHDHPDPILLAQTVLHIQSPTLQTTFIHLNLADNSNKPSLGLTLPPPTTPSPTFPRLAIPWVHVQVRSLGSNRPWAFEMGLMDSRGGEVVVRWLANANGNGDSPSSSDSVPRVVWTRQHPKSAPNTRARAQEEEEQKRTPMLLLPLAFDVAQAGADVERHPGPRGTSPWRTFTAHIPSVFSHFAIPALYASTQHSDDEPWPEKDEDGGRRTAGPATSGPGLGVPNLGTFASISYVRVYASCRLRRIWLSQSGPAQKPPWEFELYA